MRGRRGGKDGRCRAAADGVGGRAKLSECGIAECELGPWRAAADGVGGEERDETRTTGHRCSR